MSQRTQLQEIEQQFDHLAQTGAYAEALELVTREAHLFPEHSQKVVYSWRMTMACRLGKKELALQLLGEAIEAGYWYGGLETDTDFELLWGETEFKRLVEICQERRARAMAEAVPKIETIAPETATAPFPLLLALHGANARVEAGHWSPAAPHGWFVALPQSSQIFGPDTYTWNDREWAIQEVRAHYEMLCSRYPVDPRRVVLAGFSQGGGLAAWLAFSGAIPARGLVLVGPFLPDVESLIPLLERQHPTGMRAYLVAGQRDRYCYGVARRMAELLPQYGVECQFDVCADLEHYFPDDFNVRLPGGLDFVLRGKAPRFEPGARARCIRDYQAAYPDPLVVRRGEQVTVGRADEQWPAYVWCTNRAGKGGWVPSRFFDADGTDGIMRRDYSAAELSVAAGDEVVLEEEEGGWFWATASDGRQGWVPAECLAPLVKDA